MALRELLVLAMTHMRSGICTAGILRDEPGRGRWVRPVKPYGSVLLGDMTDPQGTVARVGDIVALELRRPRPEPPHVEDWETDFVRSRIRIKRRLDGQAWADTLAACAEPGIDAILHDHARSLGLFQLQGVTAHFHLNRVIQTYEARMEFTLGGKHYGAGQGKPGYPVTDLAWRARGRQWCADHLATEDQLLTLDGRKLAALLGCDQLFLSIGLTRAFNNQLWPILIGVYPLPEPPITVDYRTL